MKQKVKVWALRLIITGLFLVGLLFVIILNPNLTYTNKTIYGCYTIYHHKIYDPALHTILDEANELLKKSELYNPTLTLEICLNEGSMYPSLIKAIRGQAFAWGFYDKVVLQGNMNVAENTLELNGYKWNLTQLLAHEMIHCLQFDKYGLFDSKPFAAIPDWKWEGYAEYISRQNKEQKDLCYHLAQLQNSDKSSWEIQFEDNTISPRTYFYYYILVQYCIEIKHLTYSQLLNDTTKEEEIQAEMMRWYAS